MRTGWSPPSVYRSSSSNPIAVSYATWLVTRKGDPVTVVGSAGQVRPRSTAPRIGTGVHQREPSGAVAVYEAVLSATAGAGIVVTAQAAATAVRRAAAAAASGCRRGRPWGVAEATRTAMSRRSRGLRRRENVAESAGRVVRRDGAKHPSTAGGKGGRPRQERAIGQCQTEGGEGRRRQLVGDCISSAHPHTPPTLIHASLSPHEPSPRASAMELLGRRRRPSPTAWGGRIGPSGASGSEGFSPSGTTRSGQAGSRPPHRSSPHRTSPHHNQPHLTPSQPTPRRATARKADRETVAAAHQVRQHQGRPELRQQGQNRDGRGGASNGVPTTLVWTTAKALQEGAGLVRLTGGGGGQANGVRTHRRRPARLVAEKSSRKHHEEATPPPLREFYVTTRRRGGDSVAACMHDQHAAPLADGWMGGDEAWTLAAAHRSVGVPRLLPAAAAMAISTVTHWETENALGGAGGAGGAAASRFAHRQSRRGSASQGRVRFSETAAGDFKRRSPVTRSARRPRQMALPSVPLRGSSCGHITVWVDVWGGSSGMVGTAWDGVVSLLALDPCIRGTLTRTVNPDPCARGRGRSITAAAVSRTNLSDRHVWERQKHLCGTSWTGRDNGSGADAGQLAWLPLLERSIEQRNHAELRYCFVCFFAQHKLPIGDSSHVCE
ncbi:hypothetical protein BU14_0023s0051 [Porphyra umbilicalis]|uniref:Uncharacterized protein n=1 Tax=Porphyra umbilicalis TaxID=2786 RepID=A0A1X6PKF6_PORUM|nr:hypothetical protein BU14_0023s0051 [Porphyra umbilicalis]|eukprot:OSX81246.1 hypothetical protein BU14_0023s0051 [Porphyra umbilicalis]